MCAKMALLEYIIPASGKSSTSTSSLFLEASSLMVLCRAAPDDVVAVVVVRACELLAQVPHINYKLTQWHRSPFDEQNASDACFHRCGVDVENEEDARFDDDDDDYDDDDDDCHDSELSASDAEEKKVGTIIVPPADEVLNFEFIAGVPMGITADPLNSIPATISAVKSNLLPEKFGVQVRLLNDMTSFLLN
jgi:hypothetical protein